MTTEKQNKILNKKSFNFFYAMGRLFCISSRYRSIRYIEDKINAKTKSQKIKNKIKLYRLGILATVILLMILICIIGMTILIITENT